MRKFIDVDGVIAYLFVDVWFRLRLPLQKNVEQFVRVTSGAKRGVYPHTTQHICAECLYIMCACISISRIRSDHVVPVLYYSSFGRR